MRLLWLFCLCSLSFGQTTGTITGRIVDESGDPVSGANVSATNDPGQEFHSTTLGSGAYTLDHVVPGTYQVTASMNAMKTNDVKGVIVEAAKTSRLDITLFRPDGNLGTLGEQDRFTAASFAMIGQKPVPVGPVPRLVDGKPDFSGFWWGDRPSRQVEQPQVQLGADAIRQERQKNDMRDTPSSRCLPGGIIDPAGQGRLVHIPGLLVILIGPRLQ